MKTLLLSALFCLIASNSFAADKVRVQVQFEEPIVINGQTLPFGDALYFTEEQYAALTPAELQAKKKERCENWKHNAENPPAYVPPTPEQLQQELQSIKDNEVSVSDRKKEIVKALGGTELEALQTEMRDIEAKFNSVKEKLDAADTTAVPLEAVAVILDNQKADVAERIAKKEAAQ